MMNGTSTHFVLSIGYGSGDGVGFYKRVRTDYQSNNSGGDSGGDESRMETQHDTIFIQNLPHNVAPEDLREVFSQFGIIKVRYNFNTN